MIVSPYARIKEYVETETHAETGRLPPERDLVPILGLTRNQIRTALKKLEREGLIWRHVGKGTFVGERPVAPMPIQGVVPGIDVSNPSEVLEARLAIEPIMARLAAIRATSQDIDAMERQLIELQKATSPDDFQRLDRMWHLKLAQASGNSLFASFLQTIHLHTDPNIWKRLGALYMTSDRMVGATLEHQAVLDAIRFRDPVSAEETMRIHIKSVRIHVFGDLE